MDLSCEGSQHFPEQGFLDEEMRKEWEEAPEEQNKTHFICLHYINKRVQAYCKTYWDEKEVYFLAPPAPGPAAWFCRKRFASVDIRIRSATYCLY